ncbi:HNRNPLL [Bugula neritina]|uniref:HNRNPLL n=1 Tax=Bugula neritina TaxID=10212 RepID=A0A7J7KPH1_BUGNE|nr:HNRNPLL [Bugula neritina]
MIALTSVGGRGDGRREDRFQSGVGRGGGSGGIRTYEKNPDIERHNAPPSRVLHVRGLKEYATQNDIVDAVKQFGRVTYVMMIPRNRQALVEMESVDAAKMVVRYAESSAIYVCGHPAFFNFSTSDSIKRPEGMPDFDSGMGNGPKQMESNILVIVVQNPKYPITVDVIHTITSPHGDVLRIMIMRKQNVTALVEFDNYESARKAKQALNGCDVYSGCCTLKIESAGPDLTRLNVMKNDKDTFDYTNPNPGAGMQGGRGALLGDGPPRGGGFGNSSSGWDDGGNQSQGSSFFGDQNQGFNQRGFSGGNDNSFNGPGVVLVAETMTWGETTWVATTASMTEGSDEGEVEVACQGVVDFLVIEEVSKEAEVEDGAVVTWEVCRVVQWA